MGKIIDLLDDGVAIEYGKIPIKDDKNINVDLVHRDFSLKLYVEKKEEQNLGWSYVVKLEDYDFIQMAEERVLVKPVKQTEFFIYTDREIEGYTPIFAKRRQVQLLIKAISEIVKTNEWFNEPTFNIHENEKALRREFGNFTRFYTRDMSHELVKSASVGGVALEKSPDYKRYLKDYSGYLSAVVTDYNGIRIMLSVSGKIWSPSKQFEERKIEIIADILKRLLRIGAIGY